MRARLIPSKTYTIEIDGRPVRGEFVLESEWEGFMKFVSQSPHEVVIVEKPKTPSNPWDYILPVFGGGNQTKGKVESIETNVITSSLGPLSDVAKT